MAGEPSLALWKLIHRFRCPEQAWTSLRDRRARKRHLFNGLLRLIQGERTMKCASLLVALTLAAATVVLPGVAEARNGYGGNSGYRGGYGGGGYGGYRGGYSGGYALSNSGSYYKSYS